METTTDAILGGRLRLVQPKKGYRFAIDPVLLAAAVPAVAGDTVLDAGCGVGAAGLALARRIEGAKITGLELQMPLADLAGKNADANGLADRFRIATGDILEPPESLAGPFDHAMANPPYMKAGEATLPRDPVAATAVVEGSAELRDWAVFCGSRLKDGGSLTIIHRADRLADVLAAFAGAGIGGLTVLPLWPKTPSGKDGIETAARRVIVQGRKGVSGTPAYGRGLVLHGPDGGFTDEAEAVLRHAAALNMA